MTNILVQNAIIDVAKQIETNNASGGGSGGVDYNGTLGATLSNYVCGIMYEYYTSGPCYSTGGGGSCYICDLSKLNNISDFSANFSGSGNLATSIDVNGVNNVWTNGSVLSSSGGSLSGRAVVECILSQDTVLNGLSQGSPDVERDILIEYAQLKKTIQAANTTVHEAWYGAGGSAAAGQPLSRTNLLKVCGTNWKCGEGANCTWTVPAGATRAKFQLWGAGQGGGVGCCCGGMAYTFTGAYSEMVMDVTAGDSYTICAGCSCQRSCCSNDNPGCGCMSFVTGNGICCLKADGGNQNEQLCHQLNHARINVSGALGSSCRRYQSICCSSSGPCFCNSANNWCFASSCATCGVVPTVAALCSGARICGCICACDDRNAVQGAQYSHSGMGGGGCFDTNQYGYLIRPPIIDADTGSLFSCETGCWCLNEQGGQTRGACDAHSWNFHPGMGGTGQFNFGGCASAKGDYGRGGLVQVSWE